MPDTLRKIVKSDKKNLALQLLTISEEFFHQSTHYEGTGEICASLIRMASIENPGIRADILLSFVVEILDANEKPSAFKFDSKPFHWATPWLYFRERTWVFIGTVFNELISNLSSPDALVQTWSAKILLHARDRSQYFPSNNQEVRRPILDDSQAKIVEDLVAKDHVINSFWDYFDDEEFFDQQVPSEIDLRSVTDLSILSIGCFSRFNLNGWPYEFQIRDVDLTAQVLGLLNDDDWRYRKEVLNMLRCKNYWPAEVLSRAVQLTDDPHPSVRLALASCGKLLGAGNSFQTLLTDNDEWVRRRAIRTYSGWESNRNPLFELLLLHLDDTSPLVFGLAAELISNNRLWFRNQCKNKSEREIWLAKAKSVDEKYAKRIIQTIEDSEPTNALFKWKLAGILGDQQDVESATKIIEAKIDQMPQWILPTANSWLGSDGMP